MNTGKEFGKTTLRSQSPRAGSPTIRAIPLYRYLLLGMLAGSLCLIAGGTAPLFADRGEAPLVILESTHHDTSPPLSELAIPGDISLRGKARVELEAPSIDLPPVIANAPIVFTDPSSLAFGQPLENPFQAPAVDHSTSGFGDADHTALIGAQITPPALVGDVGRKFYIQHSHSGWMIFDKTDGHRIAGPFNSEVLWSGFGGVCETGSFGDPTLLFDHVADRWVFGRSFDRNTAPDLPTLCFAISATADPLGSYHRFEFSSESGFPGRAELGLWATKPEEGIADRDAYLLTGNGSSADSSSASLFAFDRGAMLAGDTARAIRVDPASGSDTFFGIVPAHLEGYFLPRAGSCGLFMQPWDDEVFGLGNGPDGYQFWELCADFDTPESSSLVGPVFVQAGVEWDSELCGFGPCLEQPGTDQRLDPMSHSASSSAQLRGFDTEEGVIFRMVADHTTDVGDDQAGIHWTQFDLPCLSTGTNLDGLCEAGLTGIEVLQSSTWAPDGDHRAFAAIAQDRQGNVGMGYSVVGHSTFPSLRYSVQKADDKGAVLADEGTCATGGSSQIGSHRWQDHVSMSVDPENGCTFWMTGEYMSADEPAMWESQLCSFTLPSCAGSCEELTSIDVGHFTASFEATTGQGDGQWCAYENVDATISIGPFELAQATLSFRKRPGLDTFDDITFVWSGNAQADLPFDDIEGSLTLDRLEIEIAGQDLKVSGARGQGTFGEQPNHVHLRITARDDALTLMGNGSVSTEIGPVPLFLSFSSLDMTYDFESVAVTQAVGQGRLGDEDGNHIDLTVGFENEALTVAGTGRLETTIGTLPMELELTDFDATYDFEDFRVTAAAGQGTLGDTDEDHLEINVGFDGDAPALTLEGTGKLSTKIGSLPIELTFTELSANYDFEKVVVKAAEGSAVLGDEDGNHVQLSLALEEEALAVSGSGSLETSVGSLPLELHLTAFEGIYDFNSFMVKKAAGNGLLGEEDGDHVAVVISYADDTFTLNGSGRLTITSTSMGLEIQVEKLIASYDFTTFSMSDFQGNAKLKKGDDEIAAATLSWSGSLIEGQFTITGEPSYQANNFTVSVDAFDIQATYDISSNDFRLVNGSATLGLSDMEGLEGKITFEVAVSDGAVSTAIDGSDSSIQAFGMTLEDFRLALDFNSQLELSKVSGRVTARHDDIDGVITVKAFEIEEGTLTVFRIHGNVSYQRFELALTDGDYENNELKISGKVAVIEVGQVEVEDFVIDEDGEISLGSIEAEVQQNPVDIRFSAEFQENRFRGTIEGTFTPSIGIEGTIDVGSNGTASDPWTHVYTEIVLPTSIPLGTTGLKVTSLGGSFGFNYNVQNGGMPERGTHGVGVTLGIGDIGGLFEVEGSAYVQFGPTVLILLEGNLSVPAQNPVARGTLVVRYVLPEGQVSGHLSTTIKIPSGSGSIIHIDNQTIHFNFESDSWWIRGQDLEGSVLSVLMLSDGVINFEESSDAFSGELGGRVDFSASDRIVINTIESCSDWRSVGLELRYSVGLSAGMSLSFGSDDVRGSFEASAHGSASAEIKPPLFDCRSVGISVHGNIRVDVDDDVCLSGGLEISPSPRPLPSSLRVNNLCI